MKKPRIPKNEKERLENLESYQLIGLKEQEEFDFLTSMASIICETKISLISLITDDKQWFLSHHGLETRETPKDYAFCAHAINSPDDPFIIEDAKEDKRFYDNPLTTGEPHVIFYAGIPLVSSAGYPLGTLCAIDDKPKKLTEEQIEELKKLAKLTSALFEKRRNEIKNKHLINELDKKNELLEETQKVNKIGIWELDIVSGKTIWNDLVYEIHEVPKGFDHNKTKGIEFYHKNYRKTISDAVENCITKAIPYDLECILITGKKNQKWVRTTGRKVGDKLIGSFQDITDIILKAHKQKLIIEGTNVGTWEWNVQTGETVFNERWADIVGYTLEELAPISIETWMKLAHPDDLEESGKRLTACFEKKSEFYEFEARMKHKEGHWVWVYDRGKVMEWTEDGKPLWMYGTHHDITKRKQNEEALRISEEAFRGHFENAAVGMAIISPSGQWLKVNRKVCEIVGYSAEELMQLTFQDITHPEDLDIDLGLLNELVEGKRDHYQMEKRYFHKDGHIVYIILAVSMVEDDEGNVLYFISQIIDISKRKIQEQEIAYQQNLLSLLYKLSPIGIALDDYDTGKFVDVNDKLLEPSGYTKEEFLSLSYWDITPKEYQNLEDIALQQMESGGKYENFEKEYIRKDGSRYPVSLQGVVVTDTKGKKLIWSFIRDISREKEAERKLKEAIARLQAVLDASKQVSIIATDTNGIITLFNSGAEQMLGYKAEELVGQQTPVLIHLQEEIESEGKALSEKYGKEINGVDTFAYEAQMGHPNTKEWTYQTKDGHQIPVLLSVNKISVDNTIKGYLGVATDISELKKVEKEIRSLLRITEEQNDRLKNFAHIVSHNLRSHSGGISSLIELFQLEHTDFANNEFIKLLKSGSENLQQTVEDLTEIVKVNLTTEEYQEIHLYDMIERNIKNLSSQLSMSGVKLINEVPSDVVIKGITAYVDSIVLNMITNAIKYKSEERESFLKIYCEEDASTTSLFFEDNGLGIDLKKHGDKLFGMYKTFHRHDDSRGVGLFITKNQVESMGGKISVESEVNVGTTFKITFKK